MIVPNISIRNKPRKEKSPQLARKPSDKPTPKKGHPITKHETHPIPHSRMSPIKTPSIRCRPDHEENPQERGDQVARHMPDNRAMNPIPHVNEKWGSDAFDQRHYHVDGSP